MQGLDQSQFCNKFALNSFSISWHRASFKRAFISDVGHIVKH